MTRKQIADRIAKSFIDSIATPPAQSDQNSVTKPNDPRIQKAVNRLLRQMRRHTGKT